MRIKLELEAERREAVMKAIAVAVRDAYIPPTSLTAVLKKQGVSITRQAITAMSVNAIRTEARRYIKDGEDNLLIVDYVQLATSGQNKQSRVDEVGIITRGLKVLANEGECGLAVLAAAQLSRAIEQRAEHRPIMSDLRESGSLEQDADNILFLYSDDSETLESGEMKSNTRKLIIGKQRNGPTSADKGDIEVRWNAPIMRFENLATQTVHFG